MGLEEHLLTMFREDFEFHDHAGPSHHGGSAPRPEERTASDPIPTESGNVIWLAEAESELKKVPFFVRGKARRNAEAFAAERGFQEISVETLYEAKAHYAR
jgi:light-independent protochlorophyllide reductase subunit B